MNTIDKITVGANAFAALFLGMLGETSTYTFINKIMDENRELNLEDLSVRAVVGLVGFAASTFYAINTYTGYKYFNKSSTQ